MFALTPLPRTLEAAVRDFAHPKLEVRLSALRELVRHARGGEPRAASALAAALRDPLETIRAEAALGLADAECRESAGALAELALGDSAPRVRQMALLALGELGSSDAGAVDRAVAHALGSELPAERFQALLAAHQLALPEAREAVVHAMEDQDAEVRILALRVARAEFEAERALPEPALARARAALSAEEPSVRRAAALTLAEFRDTSGKSVLLELVRGDRPAPSLEDAQAAIELSAELGLGEARPALERRAFARFGRDPLAYDARIALARLGDERAKARILEALSAWTRDGRTLAVAAAGRARLGEARARLQSFEGHPERADPRAVTEALALLDEVAQPS